MAPTISQNALQKLKRALALRNRADICHAHGPMDGLIGLIDRTRPLVVTYHGYPIEGSLATGTFKAGTLQLKLFQWLEGMVLRRADAITVVGAGKRNG